MARDSLPGPASMAGLRWLARVGPAPLDAWRCAMGWGVVAARRHARRLEQQGWLERYPLPRGEGSLFLASRRGVRVSGLDVSPSAPPSPWWWAHDCACAWTAAWLTVRGRDWRGPREVLSEPGLKGTVEWRAGSVMRRAGHRPDLAVLIADGPVVIEVELARKAERRLKAVLSLYRRWLTQERVAGVIYVCGSPGGAKRVQELARVTGLPNSSLRTELLEAVEAQTRGEEP
jgi:hypothetical protein